MPHTYPVTLTGRSETGYRLRLTMNVTLIILSGPSKAGKSRTMLEALRTTLPEARLMVPKNRAALARLASGEPRANRSGDVAAVWLDDIELFAAWPGEDGLNTAALKNFARWQAHVVVLATSGGKGSQHSAPEEYAEPTRDLLRAHGSVELEPMLSQNERNLLAKTYSRDAVRRIGSQGIGAFMIAAPRIKERLIEGTRFPEGLAVVQAAVDWRRIGLVRPISQSALHALYVHYLSGPDVEERFERGLLWAIEPLYSQVALLSGRDEYQAYDYVVDYERERRRPIPHEMWREVIDNYAHQSELSSIGVAALDEGDSTDAEAAFVRADQSGDPIAAYNLGWLHRYRDDRAQAEFFWRRSAEHGSVDGAYYLGELLWEQHDVEGALTAYRQADEDGHARAAYQIGWLLRSRGDPNGAETAWRRSAQRGDMDAARALEDLSSRGGTGGG